MTGRIIDEPGMKAERITYELCEELSQGER